MGQRAIAGAAAGAVTLLLLLLLMLIPLVGALLPVLVLVAVGAANYAMSQWRAELDRICEVPEAGRRWSHRSARGRRARRASMNALTIALVAASLLCRAPAAFAQAEAPAASAEKPAAATLGAAKLAQEFNDP